MSRLALVLAVASAFVACAPTLKPVDQPITSQCSDRTQVFQGTLTATAGVEKNERDASLLSEDVTPADAAPPPPSVSLTDLSTAAARCTLVRDGAAILPAQLCVVPGDGGAWVSVRVTDGGVKISQERAELDFTAAEQAPDGGQRSWEVHFGGRSVRSDVQSDACDASAPRSGK